ncbi:MAG: DsbE family thiol:disulfide interchange protein [Albidovulum sp.]|nr:DsbE family thiol:disulfide interchange protein [Albidovulum sp.]MDE0306972.1 DsbE family thiol:disulfide interchange protein [Albidovulum sp.]MDE0530844.1 DsbE family thiol:disulfide interchange protein [Albidovulum sp.]
MIKRLPPQAALPPTIFIFVAVLFYWGLLRENPDSLPSSFVGRNAPGFELAPFEDMPLPESIEPNSGDMKLINFWASWCAPCRAEHPQLLSLKNEGYGIIGVNYKDDPAHARAFLLELGNPYSEIGADPEGRTAIEWGVYGIPETFVVGADGKVALRFAGPITSRVLKETVRPALGAEARE